MNNMGPEAKVEADIVAWAKANGGLALKLKLDGLRGFPDRTFLFSKGLALFLEVKKPKGGVVSQQQKVWVERLRKLGFVVDVVRSVDEARYALKIARQRRRRKRHYEKVKDTIMGRCQLAVKDSRKRAVRYNCQPILSPVSEMVEAFKGACELCGKTEDELTDRLHADHNHDSGKFRGWLCESCNIGLGRLQDNNPALLRAAADYVERNL